MADSLTCKQFATFLRRRTEHIQADMLEDWFPTDDAWVGHVATGQFPAFAGGTVGYEHTFSRFHVASPDLTGNWETIKTASCDSTPCDPTDRKIGYGTSNSTYSLKRRSYSSPLICWDQNVHIDDAPQQWGIYIKGLKNSSKVIMSDRVKTEALRNVGTLHLCGANLATCTPTFTETDGASMVLDTGGVYPTSILTQEYLDTFIQPLQLEGYFRNSISKSPVFKLITDMFTSRSLSQANPTLAAFYQFKDFAMGSEFYKVGATSGVGNFVHSIDELPMRFNKRASDGKLVRVYSYENAAATTGIKPTVSSQYINAEFQFSVIWHPQAMRLETFKGGAIHPEMPFMNRDLAGQWQFAMDNLVVDGCSVDNRRGNKGLWFADFENATKFERPELYRGILHQRYFSPVTDVSPTQTRADYSTQTTASENSDCTTPEVISYDPTNRETTHYGVAANTVTIGGITIVHDAVQGDTIALLVADLNDELGMLGTWAAVDADTVSLTTTANDVVVTFLS